MSLVFKRTVENFTCEHCGKQTQGNGYTNHCPFCLWSKHVDNNPGDRGSECDGMMEPIRIEYESQEYMINHKCIKCGAEKRNKSSAEDSMDMLIKISKNNSI